MKTYIFLLFLNPFNSTALFLYPLKTTGFLLEFHATDFLVFSGGIGRDQWHKMG